MTIIDQLESAGRASGVIETDGYRDGVRVGIPYIAVRGAGEGPRLTALACQHGRELNGIESIRRVLTGLDPTRLRGSCLFIPCANPLAVRMRQQDYPHEYGRYLPGACGFNLNRVWPGKADGTLYERMAAAMWQQAVGQSDICIDLHGWSGRSASLVWGHKPDAALVRAFGMDIHMIKRDLDAGAPDDGCLETACARAGIQSITAELTPQGMLSERAVRAGERGILNIMKRLDMLDGEMERPATQFEFAEGDDERVLTAPSAGLLVCDLRPPAPVARGQVFARLVDLNDVLHVEELVAPIDGILFNTGPTWGEAMTESCIVDAGERVALVKKCKKRGKR